MLIPHNHAIYLKQGGQVKAKAIKAPAKRVTSMYESSCSQTSLPPSNLNLLTWLDFLNEFLASNYTT